MAAVKSKVASGTLAGSKAQDIIKAQLDEDTRQRGAGPELRGVQNCGGTQAGERIRSRQVILGQTLFFRCSLIIC